MRLLIILAIGLLTACSPGQNDSQRAVNQVTGFYAAYLKEFTNNPPPVYQSHEMQRYVASDTLNRLANVDAIPDQELVTSDYFTYTQDYDPAWIPAFKAGPVRDFLGGKIVDVWIGIDAGKHRHLETYLRWEDGAWKIYRVRDVSNNYESPIFDAGRLQRGW